MHQQRVSHVGDGVAELRLLALIAVALPQRQVLLLPMRMHVGVGLEGLRTVRTPVQIDAHVGGHVLLKQNKKERW